MKWFPWCVVVCVVAAAVSAFAADRDRDVLYQLSTLPALGAGLYDGLRTSQEVLDKGDFGIGTFHGIDGEMVLLDGTVYQVLVDGRVVLPDSTIGKPFATVKFFVADQTGHIKEPLSYGQTCTYLDSILLTPNIPVAVRIEGEFESVKVRSVPAQEPPYPTLGEVLEQQQVFLLTNTTGTAIGFRFPASLAGVQAVGYHLHFLTQDRNQGGHVLDFRLRNAQFELDYAHEMRLEFPAQEDFYKLPEPQP